MELQGLVLAFLVLGLASDLAASTSLKGRDVPCSQNDGEPIHIPGITDSTVMKIKCVCMGGVGRCQKVTDECLRGLQGCHFTQPSRNISCTKECRPCRYEGRMYKSGQEWTLPDDECVVHKCFSGVVTTTRAQCATPMCPNPTPPTKGQCCPSCQGCSRAGQLFREGETKADVLDPCNECTCRRGHLECVKRACPVLPCSRNLVRSVKGQCCPVCARSQPFTSVKDMCQFRGRVYNEGSTPSMTGDWCTNCTCTNAADFPTMVCTRKTCPPLNCPPHHQRLKKGQCCYTCNEAAKAFSDRGGVRQALPGMRAQTEATSVIDMSSNKDCTYKGKVYKARDNWSDGCSTCTCWPNGETHCQAVQCPQTSCPPEARLVNKPGKCCPTCEFSEGVCTVFGDPHYKTFDGRVFNFQGSCKYLLAQDCGNMADTVTSSVRSGKTPVNNSTFSVRITNDARDSMAFSWTRTITVRLAGLKISLLQRMRVKVNGKKVTLPYIQLGVLSVMRDGYRVILRTTEGESRNALFS